MERRAAAQRVAAQSDETESDQDDETAHLLA